METQSIIEKNAVAHSLYWCHWSKMRLVEHPHAILTESDLPCPFFNNVFSADIPESQAEAVVNDLIGRFSSRSAPFFWWSGPMNHDERVESILRTRGVVKAFEAAAMAIDLDNLARWDHTAAEIVEVVGESQMADWTGTCAAVFEFDDALSGWWHELFTSLPFGDSTPLRHFLATIDGTAVGVASAFIEDGVVGLASVGVREEHRRRGIGSALTVTALETARNLGCWLGVLFSSPMATSMYEGLGFRQYGTGRCHSWSPQEAKAQTRSWV